ncbi:MAG: hypothetical protein DRN29_03320 [Thermoplasmata archaeon]|nr:MAG: hypothetical protein DRN29_03320 [Thermoplasmata archaeon]
MKKLWCIAISIFLIFPAFANGEDKIESMLDKVDGSILLHYIETIQNFGEHPTGSEACNEVAEYLQQEFESFGLEVSIHEWKNNGYEGKNIVAILPGEKNSSIILSAHYDSYPTSPGADDDGSGIACLLMAAKIMSSYKFHYTIKFVAFSGEEQGMLGSQIYVKELYESNEDVVANINVDTVAHATSKEGGKLLRVLTDEASLWITDVAEEMAEKYGIDLSLYRHGNFPAGDHQSFIDYGYEAVFFVEYEFNENMHTPNDTLENINISYLTKVCKLVLASVAKIADIEFSVRIIFKEPKMGRIYFGEKEILRINKPYPIIIGRIHALAEATEKIKRVEFYFDGELKGFSYDKPYEYVYTNKAFFSHEIKARGIGENSSDICRMKVRVFNLLPPGPPHG